MVTAYDEQIDNKNSYILTANIAIIRHNNHLLNITMHIREREQAIYKY